jgi:hypothetical protein
MEMPILSRLRRRADKIEYDLTTQEIGLLGVAYDVYFKVESTARQKNRVAKAHAQLMRQTRGIIPRLGDNSEIMTHPVRIGPEARKISQVALGYLGDIVTRSADPVGEINNYLMPVLTGVFSERVRDVRDLEGQVLSLSQQLGEPTSL